MKNNDRKPNSDSFSIPLQLSTDGEAIKTDQNLITDGWERRHLVDPDRAKESIELYASMGFEVLAQKLKPEDFGPQCQSCASTICRTYVLIYTRKLKGRQEAENTEQPAGES